MPSSTKRVIATILMLSTVAVVFTSIFIYISQTRTPTVCDEAKQILCSFTVKVYEWDLTWKTYNLSIDTVAVLHYHEGFYVLETTSPPREECVWQLVVGVEDYPATDSKGDYCDVIIKITKLTNGDVWGTIGVLGCWQVKVYYPSTVLQLDSTKNRWVHWKLWGRLG